MTIKAFHLGNFKSFGKTQRIPMKAITLLYGPNSAGKTSVIEGLEAARSIAFINPDEPDEKESLRTYITRKRHRRNPVGITFGLEIDCPDVRIGNREFNRLSSRTEVCPKGTIINSILEEEWPITQFIDPSSAVDLSELTLSEQLTAYDDTDDGVDRFFDSWRSKGSVLRVNAALFGNYKDLILSLILPKESGHYFRIVNTKKSAHRREYLDATGKNDYPDFLLYAEPENSLSIDWNNYEELLEMPCRLLKSEGDPFLQEALRTTVTLARRLTVHTIRQAFPGSKHISGIRPLPLDNELIGNGDQCGATRESPTTFERLFGGALHYVNLYLKNYLGIPAELRMIRHDFSQSMRPLINEFMMPKGSEPLDSNTLSQIQVIDTRSNLPVKFNEVGTGIGQILPILIELADPFGSHLLAIEQPELHLHPRLAANLGDVFLEGRFNSEPSFAGDFGPQFLIETHSEHLMLRIQKRMRQTAEGRLPENIRPVTPDDVAVLYVSNENGESRVQELEMAEDGRFIDPWPDGFFEEGFEELFG